MWNDSQRLSFHMTKRGGRVADRRRVTEADDLDPLAVRVAVRAEDRAGQPVAGRGVTALAGGPRVDDGAAADALDHRPVGVAQDEEVDVELAHATEGRAPRYHVVAVGGERAAVHHHQP